MNRAAFYASARAEKRAVETAKALIAPLVQRIVALEQENKEMKEELLRLGGSR